MAPLRVLLVLLILIGLVCAATAVAQAPVEWYSQSSDGGGAIAGPPPHLSDAREVGGGAAAPSTRDAPGAVNLPPPAEVAADGSQPQRAADVPPDAVPAAPASVPAAAHRAPAAQATAAQTTLADDRPIGSLPFTGLELTVIAAAGLCLLLAGFALRPARR